MTMLPVPATTVSEKLRTILESNAIAVALSAGVEELRVGAVVSGRSVVTPVFPKNETPVAGAVKVVPEIF